MRLILRWFVNAAALALTIYVLHIVHLATWTGGAGVYGVTTALIAVVIMAVINALVRPIATFLTLPLSCATFGLFAFVINAVMFWLVGSLSGVFVVGWKGALAGSILMGLISGIASNVIVSPRGT